MDSNSRFDKLEDCVSQFPLEPTPAVPAAAIDDEPVLARLREAIAALGGECDGGKSQDGVGFSRDDAAGGKELARKVDQDEAWSLEDIKRARVLAQKYHRQLGELGFPDIEKQVRTLTKKEQKALTAFDVFHVGDPATEPNEEPPPPIVDGLVYPGFVLIAGPPKKSYKTLWATYIGLCVQGGLEFFGRPALKKKVLIIQRDMGRPWFVRYVRSIRKGLRLPSVSGIPVVSVPIDLKTPEDVERLRKTIEAHGAEVVLIDSSRSTSSVEENFSEDVRKITRDVICDVLRDQLNLTVILITHMSKQGGGPRGSTEWPASADSILTFEPNQGCGFVKVTGEGRHPAFEFLFRFKEVPEENGGPPGFALEEVSDGDAKEARKKDTASKIRSLALTLAGSAEPLTKTELTELAKSRHGLKAKGTDLNKYLIELRQALPSVREEEVGRTRRFSIADRGRFRDEYFRYFNEELRVVVPAKGNDGEGNGA